MSGSDRGLGHGGRAVKIAAFPSRVPIPARDQPEPALTSNILWLNDLRLSDLAQVGGKELLARRDDRRISGLGVSVPGGFATTADAFRPSSPTTTCTAHLRQAEDGRRRKRPRLTRAGARSWLGDRRAAAARPRRRHPAPPTRSCAPIPAPGIAVAVRSSATAEDLPDASFAGQQETFLNVTGADDVVRKVKEVFASLYNDRAIATACTTASPTRTCSCPPACG